MLLFFIGHNGNARGLLRLRRYTSKFIAGQFEESKHANSALKITMTPWASERTRLINQRPLGVLEVSTSWITYMRALIAPYALRWLYVVLEILKLQTFKCWLLMNNLLCRGERVRDHGSFWSQDPTRRRTEQLLHKTGTHSSSVVVPNICWNKMRHCRLA